MSRKSVDNHDASEPLLPSGETTPLVSDLNLTPTSGAVRNALGRLGDDEEDDDASRSGALPYVDEGELDEGVVEVPGEDTATTFVWILVGAAAISGLLFGYDTGVISGMLINLGSDLGSRLTVWELEMIVSATTLGALPGGLIAGALSDYTGRKPVIVISNIMFILGALLQAAAHSVSTMIWGRLTVGLGVGLASCIIPLYIGELAPTKIRGRLVTINNVTITLGQLIAYAIGAVFQHTPGGWRWMVGLGALPSLVQLLALTTLPESPRILLLRSRLAEAKEILGKVYPLASDYEIEAKVRIMALAVKQSVASSEYTTWVDRLKSLFVVGANRRALIIGSGLQAAQQLCGFNSLMYYSATLFMALGFQNATLVGCLIAGINFAFTLVALKIVDPLGRRKTMLYTLPVMIIALTFSSIFFHQLTLKTGGVLVPGSDYSSTYSTLVVSSMMLYVAGYATGLGNIPWQQGELFRLDVRGLGTSICTATNWTCNAFIASTFLSLMRLTSPAIAFGIYAGFCVIAWVFCYLLYPETSGLSLEEVYLIFENDFGVVRSQRIRQEKLAASGSVA